MLFKSTINETFNKAGRGTEEKRSSGRKEELWVKRM